MLLRIVAVALLVVLGQAGDIKLKGASTARRTAAPADCVQGNSSRCRGLVLGLPPALTCARMTFTADRYCKA